MEAAALAGGGGAARSSPSAVQATNDDAAASKLSCVNKGYMKDDYVRFFVRRATRRAPIINRGYYARWSVLRKLMLQFLNAGKDSNDEKRKQILSLGAGFDTTFFQLQDEGIAPHLYVELDFKEVTSKKAAIINRYSEMKGKLGPEASISIEKGEVTSAHYKLFSADIRDIPKLDSVIRMAEMDPSRYTWEEIQASTSSFSVDLIIGKGSYGTVYKAKLRYTVVAVKILNSTEGSGIQQLQQELEVLGKVRHPHLLLMLGACPEHGCLVYEYMDNGSLDDMLQRRNNRSALTWSDRFRIAWEVATALMFLHSSKPEPIIHRDLKPANILLDRNLVSKIGDVGLSTLLPSMDQYMSTMIKNTAPVGTFCYIDPEYQRTDVLSMKSDVYALGIVILQLLTARSPMGLAHIVETALEDGCFVDILDATAGEWPLKETQELAVLALRCSEMRRRDRPDLNQQVLPTLERLKDFASKSRKSPPSAPPSHFICPILQEVMVDPYVASDGYTYDLKAIEMWLSMNDKSPMTNLHLLNKSLIPNHSLRSAIMDWRSKDNCN